MKTLSKMMPGHSPSLVLLKLFSSSALSRFTLLRGATANRILLIEEFM